MGRWRKANKEECASNVLAFIAWFNRTTNWIISEIVTGLTAKQRAKLIVRFIEIGEICMSHSNINTTMEIVSALNQAPVFRLKTSWDEIPDRHKDTWAWLRETMSPDKNYAKLREYLKTWKDDGENKMPFVGLLLQDLLACEEVPTWTSKNLINFIKLRQITRIIKQIKSYQMPLSTVMPTSEAVREYLTSDELIILEEKDQYKFSRLCEPKKES